VFVIADKKKGEEERASVFLKHGREKKNIVFFIFLVFGE